MMEPGSRAPYLGLGLNTAGLNSVTRQNQVLSGASRIPEQQQAFRSTNIARHNINQVGTASIVNFNFCTYLSSPKVLSIVDNDLNSGVQRPRCQGTIAECAKADTGWAEIVQANPYTSQRVESAT
jgi:hypothetical protein